MHNISLGIINGNYMCQLQSSPHQAVYVKNTKANHILETMISRRYHGLTHKHIWWLHIKTLTIWKVLY